MHPPAPESLPVPFDQRQFFALWKLATLEKPANTLRISRAFYWIQNKMDILSRITIVGVASARRLDNVLGVSSRGAKAT
jgi:hypothetical protein